MIWWLLACDPAPSPAQDARLFAEAMDAAQDPASMEICARIGDTATREECEYVVAWKGAVQAGEDPESRCAQVSAGLWRQECYFNAAESWRRKREPERAAPLCVESGRFAADCRKHLFQSELRAAVQRPAAGFSQTLDNVAPVYCKWKGLLGDSPSFERDFWEKAWHGAFFGQNPLDLGRCAVLPEGDREHCEKAGARYLASELDRVLVQPRLREAFCADPSSAPVLPYEPHPVLQGAIQRHVTAVCAQGLERPDGIDDPEISPGSGTRSSLQCPG